MLISRSAKNRVSIALPVSLFLFLLAAGCETFPLLNDPNLLSPSNLIPPDGAVGMSNDSFLSSSLASGSVDNPRVSALFKGMSKGAALNVMLGQGLSGRNRGFFNPRTYRSEAMKSAGRLVEVYYLPNSSDPSASSGETPLVFDNDQLVGWGWQYYYKNVTP